MSGQKSLFKGELDGSFQRNSTRDAGAPNVGGTCIDWLCIRCNSAVDDTMRGWTVGARAYFDTHCIATV